MFSHYLKNFLRHCTNNKVSTSIHVLGLSLGMAVCALLAVFVVREFSYDQAWPDKERIFRFNTHFEVPGRGTLKGATAMGPLRDLIKRELPEIEKAARLLKTESIVFVQSENGPQLKKEEFNFIDAEFLDIFPVNTIDGDLKRLRTDPTALAITQAFAKKHFGTQAAVGKTLDFQLEDLKFHYEVVAIIEDAPTLSDLEWQALVLLHPPSLKDYPNVLERWYSTNVLTYVKLHPEVNAKALEARLPALINQHFPKIKLGSTFRPTSEIVSFQLLAAQQMHLDSEHDSDMKPLGNRETSILYLFVSILVLCIACINFVNMSVARAMNRAREISIRKVLGASRQRILVQVTFESILLALASYCVALVWIELFAEPFFVALQRPMTVKDLPLIEWILASSVFASVLGALSGLYPALVISRFQPSRMLKSNQSTSSKGASLARSALIITQFVISSALIVATGMLWAQNELANNIELGYDHNTLVSIGGIGGEKASQKVPGFEERLKEIPGVQEVSLAQFIPGGHQGSNTPVRLQDEENSETVLLGALRVGGDFFRCLNVNMLAGHDLSDQYGILPEPTDESIQGQRNKILHSHAVINRAALQLLGFEDPQEAVGKRLFMDPSHAGVEDFAGISYEIVGVVEDLRLSSLHRAVRPALYSRLPNNTQQFALVRLDIDTFSTGLNELRDVAKEWFPGPLTEVKPVDQVFYRAYEKERRDSALMAGAGLAALGVAVLGLFGLSMFVVKQQRKEIGIRKTFGASSSSIVVLMFMRFCKPLLFASLLGSGVGLYLVNERLETYAQHVEIGDTGLMIGLATIVIHLVVAALAVAPHSYKVANMHPREALLRE